MLRFPQIHPKKSALCAHESEFKRLRVVLVFLCLCEFSRVCDGLSARV